MADSLVVNVTVSFPDDVTQPDKFQFDNSETSVRVASVLATLVLAV
jgi:hypothetical protein